MDEIVGSYDIGQLYDEHGNAIDPEHVAAMVVDQYEAAGISPADVGQLLNLAAFRRGAGAAPAAARPNALMNVMRNPALLRGLAQRVGLRMAPQVQQTSPGPVDETPLPIDSGANVAAGASIIIQTTSQIIFRPRRLIVPESIATFFTVDRLDVGNVPTFASAGSIPAEAFRPDSVNPNVRKVTAQPGVQILVGVTNVDGVPHRFRGAIFGEGSQPSGRC